MLINKILNNNVIVSVDENNNEIICMGRGIAFNKKCGDEVLNEMIDKIYKLSSEGMSSKFQELLANIPLDYMKLSDEIIEYAKTSLGKKLNESSYISLTDHVYTAIQRFLDGVLVKNALLWEVKRFYKDEFIVGMKALDMIENRFNVRLPDDEAGFIALHIVNAQLEEGISIGHDITGVIHEISKIVTYYFSITFDENSVYYYRFCTHLKFFAQRLFTGNEYRDKNDDGLLDVIKVKYADAYACVQKITSFIADKYAYDLSDEEQLYLTIHITRIVQESKR
ncbi:BglG family transcription antiterminator LicT [Clostridium uliginosum]|uniref:Beta-glucoside operon transcriptional antiterminator n=1 Tax=Clostridium uliginosum TaxID=119641 RepID=A0A1I1GP48_9CLOT|nr:PRD domain-containing protein [Clostridium uliginosum]SFC13225.1 beta-glucoside operon transcriptional antiterminator [Clostridium uliginosum]